MRSTTRSSSTRRWSNDRDQLITDAKDLDYGNGTRLWDAVGASLDELKTVDGRKVILVFTDGDDTESKLRLGTVLDRARADEVMIYAIGLESVYFNGQQKVRTRPDSGLRKIADETGGGYFELTKASDLAPTFTKVAQELHSQYVIGFTPTALDNKVHKLVVKMKQPGMTAQARRSYLAAGDKVTGSGSSAGRRDLLRGGARRRRKLHKRADDDRDCQQDPDHPFRRR